jgi:hypothetical protein
MSVMDEPDFEAAQRYALERLRRELSPLTTYHSLVHTRDEVAPAADQFAVLEDVTGEDLLLLRTAALYHDIGFVEQHHDHEDGSVRIVTTVLPGFGYEPVQIDVIVGIILATQLPQQPHTLLEQIMADADLNILGQADYLPRRGSLMTDTGGSQLNSFAITAFHAVSVAMRRTKRSTCAMLCCPSVPFISLMAARSAAAGSDFVVGADTAG